MITRSKIYGKYITIKVLSIVIGFIFVAITCVTSLFFPTAKVNVYDSEFSVHQIVQVIWQFLFLFTIAVLYSYVIILLFYVHGKARRFDNHSDIHSRHSYSYQLIKIVFLIYLSLVFFHITPSFSGDSFDEPHRFNNIIHCYQKQMLLGGFISILQFLCKCNYFALQVKKLRNVTWRY